MFKNLLLIIVVFLESTTFCQSDPLKNFESNNLENWPVDSSTINYENIRKTKLRSIEDCITEINSEDLNASEIKAIEKRMEDISVFLIHQYYPTLIIGKNDLENLKEMINGCDIKFLFKNKDNINAKVKNIIDAFNRKTISYFEAIKCIDESSLEKLSLYLFKI